LSTFAKLFLVLTLVFFGLSLLKAQDVPVISPTKTFSLTAQAVALPGNKQTVAATIIGGTFQISEYFALRQENILAQAGNMTGYYGGFQYALRSLSKKLNAVSLFDANHIQFYVTASAGVDRVPRGNVDVQHYSFLAGGGANYDPSGKGVFSVNLFELRYMKAPGYNNNTAVLSTGVKFGF
jgi:hypothetical protein